MKNSLSPARFCPIYDKNTWKEGQLNSAKLRGEKKLNKTGSDPITLWQQTIILCHSSSESNLWHLKLKKATSLQLPQDAVNCAFMGNVPIKE